jgi:hypothetical protein
MGRFAVNCKHSIKAVHFIVNGNKQLANPCRCKFCILLKNPLIFFFQQGSHAVDYFRRCTGFAQSFQRLYDKAADLSFSSKLFGSSGLKNNCSFTCL